ncbi:MAG: LysR family transcriptional regulator [Comamonadaceae bacterium]|nr:LysR family transcriptional regulator [Comamonadaceae bacterium]
MQTSERNFARRIDLTSLQLFVAVGETGSIGRAAAREYMAASAVSKRLSELENAAGTALLHRHARGVELTPAGQSLLQHARGLLFGVEKMQAALSEYADGTRGQVRVHANISAVVQFLPEDLGQFARSHAGVKIELEEHLSGEVVRAVQEGAADLGVCNASALPPGGSLQSLPYREDRLLLVVPARHALAAQAAVDFAETLAFDHVGLHAASSISLAMQQAAAAAGRPIRLRMRVTGLAAMCRMIHNGLGIGLMPARAFALLGGVGALHGVPLRDAWATRQIRLAARDFASLPVPARALVAHLAAAATPPQPKPADAA